MNEPRLILVIMKFPRKEQNRILQCQVRLAGRHPLPLGIVTYTQSFKYLLHISAFHTDSSSSDLSSELLTHVLSSTCLTDKIRWTQQHQYQTHDLPSPIWFSFTFFHENITFQLLCTPETLERSWLLPLLNLHTQAVTEAQSSYLLYHSTFLHLYRYYPLQSCQRFFPDSCNNLFSDLPKLSTLSCLVFSQIAPEWNLHQGGKEKKKKKTHHQQQKLSPWPCPAPKSSIVSYCS